MRILLRPLVGLLTVAGLFGVVGLAAAAFRGDFVASDPIIVLAPRAGLVLNPGAKVKLHEVQVGSVSSIDDRSDGQAVIRLAIAPDQLRHIPADVGVEITSSTVFGAKSVDFIVPERPSAQRLRSGQTLAASHVVVEVNTVFQRLTSVLSAIDPAKLNETLGALSSALNGRGATLGESVTALDEFLTRIQPSIPALRHDIATAPSVLRTYADAAGDIFASVDNATRISGSIVDKQTELDSLLVGLIGLSDLGTQVVTENADALTDVLRLLVSTTSLTNQYHEALTCLGGGLNVMAHSDPFPVPGAEVLAGFTFGMERFRFPGDLPKVAATGGPQCVGLPLIPFGVHPPYVVADVGTNPWKYGNQGLLLNSDGLKQLLFGPIDGPPRNTLEIGHPG